MNTAVKQDTNQGAPSDRDEKGRFQKGNRGGPGNPFARQTARLRQAALDAVSDDDIRETIAALKKKAREGDVPAIKLLLSYTVGKPVDAPDPDTLDQHEFETFLKNHTSSPDQLVGIIQGMPVHVLVEMLRAILPTLLASKIELAQTVLQPQQEEQEEEEVAPSGEAAADLNAWKENLPAWMRELVEPKGTAPASERKRAKSATGTQHNSRDIFQAFRNALGQGETHEKPKPGEPVNRNGRLEPTAPMANGSNGSLHR